MDKLFYLSIVISANKNVRLFANYQINAVYIPAKFKSQILRSICTASQKGFYTFGK